MNQKGKKIQLPNSEQPSVFSKEESSSSPVQFDISEIKKVIPKIRDTTGSQIDSFKEKIINLIFKYEIFGEEEFMLFFENVCQINQHVDQDEIEQIFSEIKQFLYEQFQDELQKHEDE